MAKFIQPKIFSEFKCDGSKCNSMCCKNWSIDVDTETYQKYLELKIPNVEWNEASKKYLFKLLPNGSCPCLDDDGLCKIQKQHGESFLSITCKQYPRIVQAVNPNIFTRSFTLTCPIAADLILRQTEPLKFTQIESDSQLKVNVNLLYLDDQAAENLIELRMIAIRILQNRRMTIDQRLLTLGFFISQVGDIRTDFDIVRDNLKMLDELCASDRFIKIELPKFCRAIKFDAEDFVRIMLNLLETMYGQKSGFGVREEFLDFIKSTGTLYMDENNVSSIPKTAKKYLKLKSVREKFFKHASIIIENSLVNEFWSQCFPYRFTNIKPTQNYFFFVIMYKLKEFLLLSYLEVQRRKSHSMSKSKVEDAAIQAAKMFSMLFEHQIPIVDKISGIAKNKGDDIYANLSSMLQV